MKKDESPVVVVQTFDASLDRVWDALTRVEQMRQWFFPNIPDFRAEAGFETRFDVVSRDRHFLHLWRVTEVYPLKKITLNWKYRGYAGDSFVEFTLFEENGMTRLRLIHRAVESFPEDIPEFSRESCREGWTFFIKENLKNFIEREGESD